MTKKEFKDTVASLTPVISKGELPYREEVDEAITRIKAEIRRFPESKQNKIRRRRLIFLLKGQTLYGDYLKKRPVERSVSPSKPPRKKRSNLTPPSVGKLRESLTKAGMTDSVCEPVQTHPLPRFRWGKARGLIT